MDGTELVGIYLFGCTGTRIEKSEKIGIVRRSPILTMAELANEQP